MFATQLRRYGSWAAFAAGILSLAAIVFTALFFAFEAGQAVQDNALGTSRFYSFGFLSDLLPMLACLSAAVLVVVLYRLERAGAPRLSLLAAVLGLAANLGIAVAGTLIVIHELTGANTITINAQILANAACWAPLGIWQMLVSYLARRQGLLPARLTAFGVLAGAGWVVAPMVYFLGGGLNAAAIFSNIPLLIALSLLTVLALIGYVGAPIWSIWLGRVFLSTKVTQASAAPA